MLRTCYIYGLTKRTIIQTFYHGLDDPTQGILDAGGIFYYKTLNKVFKILEDNVLFKLDFSKDLNIKPKPKTVVSAGGSNINPQHGILMERFETLATRSDFEFPKIIRELNEMRDSLRDNGGHHASIAPCISRTLKRRYLIMMYRDEELKSNLGVGIRVLRKKNIRKDDMEGDGKRMFGGEID
ncbi:hypothetical protein Tco_1015012 [Tanacetum coccineum]